MEDTGIPSWTATMQRQHKFQARLGPYLRLAGYSGEEERFYERFFSLYFHLWPRPDIHDAEALKVTVKRIRSDMFFYRLGKTQDNLSWRLKLQQVEEENGILRTPTPEPELEPKEEKEVEGEE
ncbi:hypothetical protein BDZ97DRAFT_1755486 [Flammula alnicola]|nr:hypothetical protein BDZ97DRAFT_1755486 [Flammula alnicola]